MRGDHAAHALDLLLLRVRADDHAPAAGLAGRLDDELVQVVEHVLQHPVSEAGRWHVLQDRLLAEVEADHLGDEAVDGLVVGDTGAEGVRDRDAAGAVGADQPGTPSSESLRNSSGSTKSSSRRRYTACARSRPPSFACRARRRARPGRTPRRARLPSGGRGTRARSRRVGGPGRPHDDGRLALCGGRDGAQRAEQQLRVVIDAAHAVGGEQLGHQARHRGAVLEHVGDAGRDAHVVLDHLPAPVAVAHEIAAGDVRVDAAGRADAVHGARELRAADDQPPRHDPLAHDLARVVDVIDERVQRADALCEAALDRAPFLAVEHARHEVQRKRPVAVERRRCPSRR